MYQMGMHIGATLRILLNYPYAVAKLAMRPNGKLL